MVGYGGTQWVAAITGLDPKPSGKVALTVRRGWRTVHGCAVRAVGDPDCKKDGRLEAALLARVEPETGGDPEERAQVTRSRLHPLAKRLGWRCATPVGRLLKPLGYALKTNVKRLTGKVYPQRDRQYRFIQRLTSRFLRCGDPIISVDTKHAERIGSFKHAGAHAGRTADVVNTSDFPSAAQPP